MHLSQKHKQHENDLYLVRQSTTILLLLFSIINRSTAVFYFFTEQTVLQDIWKFRIADVKAFCDDDLLLTEVEQVA